MKKFVLFYLLIFIINDCEAQETYQKIITNPHIREIDGLALAITPTSDGGYAFCGYSYWDTTTGFGHSRTCIGKVDAKGNLEWIKHQDPYANSLASYGICQMQDNSIFAVGYQSLIRVDINGNLIWSKYFPLLSNYTSFSVVANPDNTVVFTGTGYSFGAYSKSFAICINKYGETIWTKVFESENALQFRNVIRTKDNGFLFTGTIIDTAVRLGIVCTKTDKFGNVQWSKIIKWKGYDNFSGYRCITTKDGGYGIGGVVRQDEEYSYDIYAAKLDSNFNLSWSRSFGSSNGDIIGSLIESQDSCLVVAGHYAGRDEYIVKINSKGDRVWAKTFGGNKLDDARDIAEIGNAYVTAGESYSFENNHGQMHIVRLDSSGNVCGDEEINVGKFVVRSDSIQEYQVNIFSDSRFNPIDNPSSFFSYGSFLTKCKDVVLPLDILSFTASNKNDQTILTWTTQPELNTKSFEIQRSANTIDFFTIGTIAAKNNSNSNYSYTDQNPLPQINYYRLKIIDNSGSVTYSEIRTVKNEKTFVVNIYPNPIKGNTTTIKINSSYTDVIQLSVINVQGKIIFYKKVSVSAGGSSSTLDLSLLPKGIYFLKATNGKEERVIKIARG